MPNGSSGRSRRARNEADGGHSGRLAGALEAELRGAERAVTAGVRAATLGLKAELRAQVTSAGLGQRLANTWRSRIYPEGQQSLGAAGFVWSKAPHLIRQR